MGFDCSKQHSSCKAMCCGTFPLPKEIYERNRTRIIKKPDVEAFWERHGQELITPTTDDGLCPFLDRINLRCNIYNDRPDVCKKFGDESHVLLRCPWQDKDGNTRSRQERRKIEQEGKKATDKFRTKIKDFLKDNPIDPSVIRENYEN